MCVNNHILRTSLVRRDFFLNIVYGIAKSVKRFEGSNGLDTALYI